VDAADLLRPAAAFAQTLRATRRGLAVDFEWYPYDTLSALWHIEKLLTAPNRNLLSGRLRILDLGSQDGELAFFLESLGHQVIAADHPAYNHNGMRGIRALKNALRSSIEVHEIDLDRPFSLPHDSYDLVTKVVPAWPLAPELSDIGAANTYKLRLDEHDMLVCHLEGQYGEIFVCNAH